MRIAVTYENGNIFQHFGHTEQFKLYETDASGIVGSTVVDTNGEGHGALAGLLSAYRVDVLICGGIGGGARMALESMGIRLCGGVQGSADEAVKAYLSGNLEFIEDITCSHHGASEHSCGQHGCGDQHGCSGNSCGGH